MSRKRRRKRTRMVQVSVRSVACKEHDRDGRCSLIFYTNDDLIPYSLVTSIHKRKEWLIDLRMKGGKHVGSRRSVPLT